LVVSGSAGALTCDHRPNPVLHLTVLRGSEHVIKQLLDPGSSPGMTRACGMGDVKNRKTWFDIRGSREEKSVGE